MRVLPAHQDDTPFTHLIDHIVAVRHGGRSSEHNLALAWLDCNRHKGADLSALDPLTGAAVPLFHPRHHAWSAHFALEGARVIGLTPTGRATVALLRINDPVRLIEREMLTVVGRYPPWTSTTSD